MKGIKKYNKQETTKNGDSLLLSKNFSFDRLKKIRRISFSRAFLLLIFLCFLISGYFLLQRQIDIKKMEIGKYLYDIMENKVNQIVEWKSEHISDITSDFFLSSKGALLYDYLSNNLSTDRDIALNLWIRNMLSIYKDYKSISILDKNGRLKKSMPEFMPVIDSSEKRIIDSSYKTKSIIFSNLYQPGAGCSQSFKLATPILEIHGEDTTVIGGCLIRLDPRMKLNRLIYSWPHPTAGGEIILLSTGNDSNIFTKDLQTLNTKWTAGKTTDTGSINPTDGIYYSDSSGEGIDYNRTKIIYAKKSIPGFSLIMIAKINYSEVLEYTKSVIWEYLIGLLILLLFIVLILGLIWRKRGIKYYKRMSESENRFSETLQNIQLIAVQIDLNGAIIYCNDFFLQLTGYNKIEVIGNDWFKMFLPAGYQEQRDKLINLLKNNNISPHYETSILTNKGEERNINWSIIVLRDSNQVIIGASLIGEDITDQKKAEEYLRESEERYRLLFNSSNDAVFLFEPSDDKKTGKFIEVNEVACQRLGYTKEEFLEIAPEDIIYHETPTSIPNKIEQIFKDHQALIESVHISKQKNLIPVEISSRLFRMKNKSFILTNARDISERKRFEEKILSTKQFLNSILDSLTEQLCVIDETGKIIEVNKAWQDFSDENSEKSGINYIEINYIEICKSARGKNSTEANAMAKGIKSVISGEQKSFTLEYSCHSDYQKRWFTARVNKFSGSDFNRFVILHHDITNRKLAEIAVMESEEMFRMILNTAAEAIYGIDSDGNCIFANKSCLKILGYKDQNTLLGINMHSLLHHTKDNGSPYPIEECKILQAALSRDLFHSNEEIFWRSDNTSFPAECWSYPIIKNNNLIGAVITFFDISERIQAEKLVDENRKRYKELFETANDSIILLHGSKVFECNSKTLELFDLNYDQILDHNIYEFSPELQVDGLNSRKIISEKINNAIIGSPQIFEWRFKNSKDEYFDSQVSLNRVQITGEAFVQAIIHDISELKKADEELRKLSRAVEQSPVSIVITDTSGTIEYVNPVFSDITGYSVQEAIGNNPRVLKSGLHDPDLYKNLWETISAGKNWKGELINKKKNGALYWESASISPVRNSMGVVSHFVAIKEDITDKINAQNELKKLSLALEQSPSSVLISNLDGIIEYVNPKFCQLSGYSAEEALGKNSRFLKSGIHNKEFYKNLWDTILSGSIWKGEIANKRKNLEIYWMSMAIAPLRDSDGKITHFVSVREDITDRRKKEESLNKLLLAIEQSPVSILITDLAGRIEFVNSSFCNITGYEMNEVIGKSPKILNSGLHNTDFYNNLWNTILSGKTWKGEIANMKKNGEIFWEMTSVSPIRDKNGEITHFVAVKEDITERKIILEEIKKAKESADLANRAKSEFLANMSHEIRTPMNAILGFTDILLNNTKEPQNKNYLEIIHKSGNTLLSIINDVLDISKIESGKLELHPEYVNLRQLLLELNRMFSHKIEETKLNFIINIEPMFPERLYLDEIRTRQVFLNLISNAIKFTEKGYIKINLNFNYINDQKNIADITTTVEDSGIGIPNDELNKIFHPFEQVQTQSTRKFGGTGLGLTIVSKILAKMNGKITVKSEFGQGSIFTIYLPGVSVIGDTENPHIKEKEIIPDIFFESASILVIDDDIDNRKLIKTLLEKTNLKVIEAESAEDALNKIKNTNFDLFIVDIKLPGMSGIDLVKILKKNKNTAHIPKIACTASLFSERVENVKQYFDSFIHKPLDFKLLLTELKKHLKYTKTIKAVVKNSFIKNLENLDLSILNQQQKNELLICLENGFLKEWEKIIKIKDLGSIKKFAVKLKEIGLSYNFNYITEYSQKIYDSARLFEVTRMNSLLKEYPKIIENIKYLKIY